MGGLNSMKQWESAGLANRDKIHFTESGYILIGDLLYNALLDRYLEHLKSTSSKNNSFR
jgi:lysophospholipase L1-like esterase